MERVLLTCILGFFIIPSEGSATLTVPTAGNCGDDTVLTCSVTGSIRSTGWFGLGRSLLINGAPARPEDNNKYTETRATSSFTLTIHNTDITDAGEYRCRNGFDESQLVRLNIECKASAGALSVTNGKKVTITVDKLYPSSPTFSSTFRKGNAAVTIPGSRTCSSSKQYPGYYRCIWSSSNSLDYGSYMYSIDVTTITQADPLTGSFKIVPPQTPVIANTETLDDKRVAVYGNEGHSLTIQCISTGGYPTPTVVWYKESVSSSNQLTSNSTGKLQNDGTYTVTLQHTLTPTVFDDRKSFICRSYYPQADSAYIDSETTSVILYLIRPATVQSFYIDGHVEQSNVTVDEHDAEIQFKCIIDSYPASTIKIMFEGNVLKEQIHEMSLSYFRYDATCFDAGVYICEANNGHGGKSSSNATLFVKCSPRPVRQIQRNITSDLYVPVILRFAAIAYPEPGPKGFKWHKEVGVGWLPLLSNADLKVSSSALQSNLTLKNVSNEDFGHYRITVMNDIGTYEQHLFLLAKGQQDEQTKDCEHCRMESDNTAVIVGVTLGVVCGVFASYAAYLTILNKRKTTNTGRNRVVENTSKQTTYANDAFTSNMVEQQSQLDSVTTGGDESSVKQYSDLSRYANTDKDTYDVIKKI